MGGKATDLFRFAHEHREEVVWMSQNTNTIPLDPAIEEAVRTSLDAGEYRLYGYRPGVFGLPEAIRADLDREEDDVFLTNGGIEALYAAQRALLKEGDEVIATDPGFLPIHRQAEMGGARPVELPVYGGPWRLTPEAVEDVVTDRTRALLVVDPHNPLGIGYSGAELKALAEVAEMHDLYLFHDVTYRDFDPNHTLATTWYPEGALLFYSFSKGPGLAGMRVGALVGPPALVDRVRRYDTNVLGVNVLAQRAALAALETKDRWLPRLRTLCQRNQEMVRRGVEKVDGATLPTYPSRGNMTIVDLQGTGVDPLAVEERMLLEHKVHVRHGAYLSPRFGDRFLRLSFSVPTEACKRFPSAFADAVEALRG